MSVDTVGYTGYTGVIGNGGHITTTAGTGMYVFDVADNSDAVFSGNIQNNGSINASDWLRPCCSNIADNSGSFIGNITNAGTITSYDTGLYVDDVGTATFAGVIKNYSTISSTDADGVYVDYVTGIDASNVTSGVIAGRDGSGVRHDHDQRHTGGCRDHQVDHRSGGTAIVMSAGALRQSRAV